MKKLGKTGYQNATTVPASFKKGGKVKKTGLIKAHKGERVLTVRQAKKMSTEQLGRKLNG